ncbi:MAG: YitT family protein [Lachnospiraceae bacterium]
MMLDKIPSSWKKIGLIILGSFLYAVGMNIFIAPLGLFSGGGVGLAQLITLFVEKIIRVEGINLYGIINMMINIPLLFLAFKSVGKQFFVKTLLGAGSISLFITLIPTTAEPLVSDLLTAVLIGGIVTGVGVGLILVGGGCGGGIDIVGVWAAKRYKGASVGKITLAFNVALYLVLLFLFDMEIVIYSLIYNVFFTLILDKVHYQNINVRMMIFTKEEGIDKKINVQTGRGVTEWNGIGAYTGDEMHILVSCINKYEMHEFMEIIHSIDPKAFIIVDENVFVSGNFEKRI